MTKPTALARTQASVWLDLVRGLAALLVCVGHWRNLLFVDFAMLTAHRRVLGALYLVCGCGHQAVVIFFVLSGYLISQSVLRDLGSRRWSWGRYATHRLVRLWVVLLPGLVLGGLWDWLGLHSEMAPGLYHGQLVARMIPDVAFNLTARAFFANVAFLQTIHATVFGSNGPLWSLAYEFWYYAMFPLGLFVVRAGSTLRTRLGCGALLAGIAWFVGMQALIYFPIWLAGVGLGALPLLKLRNAARALATVVYAPILLVSAKWAVVLGMPSTRGGHMVDYALAVATVALLWTMVSAREPASERAWERVSRRLADFSYTLYVGHVPMLVLLSAVFARGVRWVPDARHLLIATGLLALTIAYCYGLAGLTEFRTAAMRRWMEARAWSREGA